MNEKASTVDEGAWPYEPPPDVDEEPAARPIAGPRTPAGLITAREGPVLVKMPSATYLAADGEGPAGSPQHRHAMAGIYAVAHTLALQLNLEGEIYLPGPLGALWWPSPTAGFEAVAGAGWRWRLLLPVPNGVDAHLVKLIKDSLVGRRHLDDAADVWLEEVDEGWCVEAYHEGAYGTEGETMARIGAFMVESRLEPAGPRHEIYLSDIDMTDPYLPVTLIRQPVRSERGELR